MRRHTSDHPCPICDGHDRLRQGQGRRCAGFTLDSVAYCTREQFAGRLPLGVNLSPPAYRHRLAGDCGCGIEHGRYMPGPQAARTASQCPTAERVPIEVRTAVYSAAIARLPLRDEAMADLDRRGLSRDLTERVGYRSIPRKGNDLKEFLEGMAREFGEPVLRRTPGFQDKNGRFTFWSAIGSRDGYIVPYRDQRGRVTGLQLKLLGGKYETARGSKYAEMIHVAGFQESKRDVYITEGGLKAEVAAFHGTICGVGVPGQSLQDAHLEVLRDLAPARVIVALDQERNANTERARDQWCKKLWDAGLPVFSAVWEGEP